MKNLFSGIRFPSDSPNSPLTSFTSFTFTIPPFTFSLSPPRPFSCVAT